MGRGIVFVKTHTGVSNLRFIDRFGVNEICGGNSPSAGFTKLGLGLLSGFGIVCLVIALTVLKGGTSNAFPHQDKLLHVLAFMVVTGPAIVALPRRHWVFWVGHMIVFAAGTEVLQSMMDTGRVGSVADFVADVVGIWLAVVIGGWIRDRGLHIYASNWAARSAK